MRIDAHAHLWRYEPRAMAWIEPGSVLARDRLLPDLEARLAEGDFGQTILVQASSSAEETDWLLGLARASPSVAGVVGWTDLAARDVANRIAALREQPKLVGLRHQVQDEPDDFLARPEVIDGVKACVAAGLSYDILVFARQATAVVPFLERVGPGRFILDHGAKPEIARGGWESWAAAVREIAKRSDVWCKISGLVTEADHAAWRVDEIERYLDHLLDCFGPERLIFGSDWPVCTLAASYHRVVELVEGFVARRLPQARDGVFGDHAKAAYAIA